MINYAAFALILFSTVTTHAMEPLPSALSDPNKETFFLDLELDPLVSENLYLPEPASSLYFRTGLSDSLSIHDDELLPFENPKSPNSAEVCFPYSPLKLPRKPLVQLQAQSNTRQALSIQDAALECADKPQSTSAPKRLRKTSKSTEVDEKSEILEEKSPALGPITPSMATEAFEKDRACPNGCGLSFWTAKEYVAHCLGCMGLSQDAYPNPLRAKAICMQTLTDHINWHQGIKPYECPHCDKRFGQRGNRNAHIKTKHKDLEIPHENSFVVHDAQTWPTHIYPHRCTACNKGFSRPVGLYRHQQHMRTNAEHQQLEKAQKQNSTPYPPQIPAALMSVSQRMLESPHPETAEILGTPEDFVSSVLSDGTQALLLDHQQPPEQACKIPESVQADEEKTSQEHMCTICGKTFLARILYLAHQLDNQCAPHAPIKEADSVQKATTESTPADKPHSHISEQKLYTCPVSTCKKECRGAAEYGAHASSHYVSNYSAQSLGNQIAHKQSDQTEQKSGPQSGSLKRGKRPKKSQPSQKNLCAQLAYIQKNLQKK